MGKDERLLYHLDIIIDRRYFFNPHRILNKKSYIDMFKAHLLACSIASKLFEKAFYVNDKGDLIPESELPLHYRIAYEKRKAVLEVDDLGNMIGLLDYNRLFEIIPNPLGMRSSKAPFNNKKVHAHFMGGNFITIGYNKKKKCFYVAEIYKNREREKLLESFTLK
jgi:hypothetical protein